MTNKFLYDTHIHTVETSPCGKIPAAQTIDYYAAHGYAGLVITDHLHQDFLKVADTDHDWDHVVDLYVRGYKAAKKRADEIGFTVIFGAEMRFTDNDNDYLIYGINEEWLRAHPYVICRTAREFFREFHDEVLVMHAHPFRDGNLTVFEDAVHGVEVINANPRHSNWNERAWALCQKHPEYFRQAGSDMHRPEDRCRAGILTDRKVNDSFEYADLIRSGSYELYSLDFQELADKDRERRGLC